MQTESPHHQRQRIPHPSFSMRRNSAHMSPGRSVTREGLSRQWLKDPNKCSERELRETLERNEKVLKNTALLASLPDNGAKLRATNTRITTLLAERAPQSGQTSPTDKHSDLSVLLTNLKLESGVKSLDGEFSPNSDMEFKNLKERMKNPQNAGKLKIISLAESLEIQKEHRKRVEEENLRNAREKLQEFSTTQKTSQPQLSLENILSSQMRNMHIDGDEEEGDDDMDDDEEDEVQFVYPEPEDEGYQGYDEF